ncbi:metal ABC transporter permease [Spirillospora sp. NPDC046719]
MTGFAGRALVELVLTAVVCGVLGVQVVLRRLAFFTHALGHVAFLDIVAASVAGADLNAPSR